MSDSVKVNLRVNSQTATMRMQVAGGSAGVLSNCETANRLAVPREIRLSGSAEGGTMFDGSEDVIIFTAINAINNMDLEEMLK